MEWEHVVPTENFGRSFSAWRVGIKKAQPIKAGAVLQRSIGNTGKCRRIYTTFTRPLARARGRIARTYLYMAQTYRRYNMSAAQRYLMQAWDKQHPVSAWECARAARIKALQGRSNLILSARCSL